MSFWAKERPRSAFRPYSHQTRVPQVRVFGPGIPQRLEVSSWAKRRICDCFCLCFSPVLPRTSGAPFMCSRIPHGWGTTKASPHFSPLVPCLYCSSSCHKNKFLNVENSLQGISPFYAIIKIVKKKPARFLLEWGLCFSGRKPIAGAFTSKEIYENWCNRQGIRDLWTLPQHRNTMRLWAKHSTHTKQTTSEIGRHRKYGRIISPGMPHINIINKT